MTVTITGFNHAVAWNEFRRVANRPGNASEDAFIAAVTNVDYDFEGGGREWAVTDVRASVAVNPAPSWVVQSQQTASLLAHEQGHFDITALGLREEANRTAEITGTSRRDIRRQRNQLHEGIQRRINQANRRYDTLTNHGRNAAVQRRWEQSISAAKGRDDGTLDDLP